MHGIGQTGDAFRRLVTALDGLGRRRQQGIEAIGADAYNKGAKTVGSVLINRMKVAGS